MSLFLKQFKIYQNTRLIFKYNIHNSCSNKLQQNETSSSSTKGKWDLMSAICVERKPTLTKELNEIEKKVQNMLSEIENENSLKSDHELRSLADVLRQQKLKDGTLNSEMLDDTLQQTAQDFEDLSNNEFKKFKPADRITKADRENDKKSTNRKLDSNLVFLINEKFGDESHWVMPSTKRLEGESMRESAEKIVAEKFDTNVNVKFYGNAPCGFYKYQYPKTVREKTNKIGAKIFFYKVQYIDGDVKDKKVNYMWATRQELEELLHKDYNKNVSLFLIDE